MAALVTEAANLQDACQKLIALANERGGEDNITVVLAQVTGEHLAAPDDEIVQPELLARAPDTPRDFLLEDVGLSPPADADASVTDPDVADPPLSSTIAAAETSTAPLPLPTTNQDIVAAEPIAAPNKRGVEGRKVALFFILAALVLSLTAVYVNYQLTPDRGALQERLQKENLAQIENLRMRITTLRTQANGAAEINNTLNQLSQRLDEAVALPATKYPDVGRACSEVEATVIQLERSLSK
jgi:hypothetical protein